MKVFIPHNHRRCQVCSQNFFSDSPICFEAVSEHETLTKHEAVAKYKTKAKIVPTDKAEGYDGMMQGGIVTTLHDSAMLHCLFQNDIKAMTVSLASRFHHQIAIGQELEVRAHWVKSRRNIHFLESKITQNGRLCSSAQSQFMSVSSYQT
ncbi:PaaI family thioesterase [Vibrio kanaloae]|uniref:PaaI family thioesterase n=1 Tax=Vibrio kanaloae TaxID=170673 RepID=A0A4U1Z069_9VIBR|nr:PaaI family thioesterase [Vibrio kanaloae]TKF26569.1 PaaI family thioesterase [Vibrio kanaloae]